MPAKSIRAWPGGATRKTRIITTSRKVETVLAERGLDLAQHRAGLGRGVAVALDRARRRVRVDRIGHGAADIDEAAAPGQLDRGGDRRVRRPDARTSCALGGGAGGESGGKQDRKAHARVPLLPRLARSRGPVTCPFCERRARRLDKGKGGAPRRSAARQPGTRLLYPLAGAERPRPAPARRTLARVSATAVAHRLAAGEIEVRRLAADSRTAALIRRSSRAWPALLERSRSA